MYDSVCFQTNDCMQSHWIRNILLFCEILYKGNELKKKIVLVQFLRLN